MKHQDYRPAKTPKYEDDWIIYPVDGYGNEQMIRQFLDNEKIDAIWFITDPRFYYWLFNMSDEIRDRGIPLLYYHVWDNYPVPIYNRSFYESCDFVGCISKLTHDILCQLGFSHKSAYIPHAVDPNIFKPFAKEEIKSLRKKTFTNNAEKFIIFYNSRNARRKMTSDVLKMFKGLLDEVGQDKAFLLMHTDPFDHEGANLFEVAKMLNLRADQVAFSSQRIPPEQMAIFYNVSDVTVNISNNEGFGLSCLESLSSGTPVIVTKTGGLQDQPVDDQGNVFGVLVEPSSRSLQGSQQIPYIYDDRCADKDLVDALLKMYKMSWDQRKELGQKAHEWTLKAFGMKDLITKWDNALETKLNEYSSGNPARVRIQKV